MEVKLVGLSGNNRALTEMGNYHELLIRPDIVNKMYKIVICGDPCVGKSCLFQRYVDDIYCPLGATIGVDFNTKNFLYVPTADTIQVSIWDTAGQEKFRSIVKPYFRGSHGIMLVFDITNIQSFMNMDKWVHESQGEVSDATMILVGNKSESHERAVTFESAVEYANKLGIPYIETSAKLGENVNEAFYSLIDMVRETHQSPTNRSKSTNLEKRYEKRSCCNKN